jgi:hypothetical protein
MRSAAIRLVVSRHEDGREGATAPPWCRLVVSPGHDDGAQVRDERHCLLIGQMEGSLAVPHQVLPTSTSPSSR